jgi:hypothetical protein
MSQIETMVVFQRPVEQVFAYLSDLCIMTDWAQGVVEAERITPEAVGPGTVYRVVALVAGRRVTSPITITQYKPGRMYASVTTLGPLVFADRWEFTSEGEGTRVHQITDIHAAGLLAPLGMLAVRLLGKRLADDLRTAKRHLEPTAPLQP